MADKPNLWVKAPRSPYRGAPALLRIQLAAGENVRWIWTQTQKGKYVSGYQIVKKKTGSTDPALQKSLPMARPGRNSASSSARP